jgi:hypothetical protein
MCRNEHHKIRTAGPLISYYADDRNQAAISRRIGHRANVLRHQFAAIRDFFHHALCLDVVQLGRKGTREDRASQPFPRCRWRLRALGRAPLLNATARCV